MGLKAVTNSGTSQAASTVTIVDDTTTNATVYPVWATAASGNLPLEVSSTKLTFNPSTGLLSTSAAPVSNADLANKAYVDMFVSGLTPLTACVVKTTAALTATYANGSSGVGATLTNSSTQAAITIDGVALTSTQRVLVNNQAAPEQNGIYTVTTVGSGATNWVLTRATDFDTSSEMIEGSYANITSGTVARGQVWIFTSSQPITVGTTALSFSQFGLFGTMAQQNSDAVAITGGTIVGTTISGLSITTSTGTLAISNGKVISISNTLTFTGTDGASVAFGAGGTNAYTGTAQTYSAAQRGAFSTLTDAGTVAIDLSLANNYNLTLGGNRTLGVPTNPVAGQTGVISVRQDITGTRTLAYTWPYMFPGGTAPVLSTGKLVLDQLYYCVNSYSTSTVTVTIAAPGVMTWTAHGLVSGQRIQLATTGALPTGLAAATTYWITVIDANTFNLSTSLANAQAATFITTTGSQSGVQTATNFSITISNNLGIA